MCLHVKLFYAIVMQKIDGGKVGTKDKKQMKV